MTELKKASVRRSRCRQPFRNLPLFMLGALALLATPGGAQPFPASVELGDLVGDGALLFRGEGSQADDGQELVGIGDFNNDGFDDFAIAAPENGDVQEKAGAVYIIFGQPSEDLAVIDLGNVEPPFGVRVYGKRSTDYLGTDVGHAGDMNQDGIDDIIVGAPNFDPPGENNRGAAFVIFGNSNLPAVIDTDLLDGTNGFRFEGPANQDQAGDRVAGNLDLNNDGFYDMIVGSLGPGEAYVVFGRASYPPVLRANDLNGVNGFTMNGGELFSMTLDAAGDINADGIDDLVIASIFSGSEGRAYVVFGNEVFPAEVNLSSLNGSNGVILEATFIGGSLGSEVAGIGDFNGDGLDDLLVGAETSSPGQGTAGISYLLYGAEDLDAFIDLDLLPASEGISLRGIEGGSRSGSSVAVAGDLNSDGLSDVVIGAPFSQSKGLRTGEAYAVFGASGLPYFNELNTLDGSNGLALFGPAPDQLTGTAVAGAGDFNGDGIDDLLVGSPGYENPITWEDNEGFVHLVFGQSASGISFGSTAADCPGLVQFRSKGLTPLGGLAIYRGSQRGETILGDGSCSGTTVDLDNAELVSEVTANDLGQWVFEFELGQSALCGTTLQIVDLSNCLVSNVTSIPAP